ncbi:MULTISPECIES: TraR/DksA C4-type zinc finger protein [Serratia]|uniref:TraR/DksA C4-type zinc finger protein n=1 Tax=Serratia TaxID=613 RepID=UPI000661027E|nr:TraR/DksA C4-type zinc finger protein [Serratia sp. 506_PEND]
MDTMDNAAEQEAYFLARSLAAHQQRTHRLLPITGVRECEDCGVTISAARLAAVLNAACCVDCQHIREARCG